ncbi:hypothetical protein RZS08_01635, partial [Arthrospira platensis SPKY1]|nr:hypothetical protein [Arthrospira platensis SPKY1]
LAQYAAGPGGKPPLSRTPTTPKPNVLRRYAMSRGSGKKQKQRAKRQERKRMQHRQQAGSPYQRIGRTAGPVECYITRDWKAGGMAAILVRKETPADGGVLVAFLVDLWCIGLKD